jgi:phage gp36-like protein
MAYAVLANFIALFGEREIIALTDRAMTGTVNETLLNEAVAQASAEIDRKLASRYKLPFSRVTPALTRICCDMTRYYLSGAEANETDAVVARYKQALKDLDAVRDGREGLGLDEDAAPVTDSGAVRVNAPRRQFSAGKLSDY